MVGVQSKHLVQYHLVSQVHVHVVTADSMMMMKSVSFHIHTPPDAAPAPKDSEQPEQMPRMADSSFSPW